MEGNPVLKSRDKSEIYLEFQLEESTANGDELEKMKILVSVESKEMLLASRLIGISICGVACLPSSRFLQLS